MQNVTSRRDLIRSGATLGLLGVGLVVAYQQRLLGNLGNQRPQPNNKFTYVADIDYWQRTERERMVAATVALDLNHQLDKEVPLVLGEWSGKDKPQSNIEVMILLQPEQYVERLYQHRDGRYLWLSLIGGRSSQPFHPPDICYDADGWRTELDSKKIALSNGGEIYGLWLVGEKKDPKTDKRIDHNVFYFYLLPDQTRNLANGIVLLKLTSARYGTLEDTLAMQGDFLNLLFQQSWTV